MTTQQMVSTLMENATQEEKVLFDKITRSTESKILKDFNLTKEVVLMSFMSVWAERAEGLAV